MFKFVIFKFWNLLEIGYLKLEILKNDELG